MTENIASRWKELSGENKWKGLLDPIDVDLRNYLILYGELVQAVGDAFISEEKSKYAGGPRFRRSNFLSNTNLCYEQNKLYEVTKYLYATAGADTLPWIFEPCSREGWTKESNWMGFVAVATNAGKRILGRREVVIVWRGTLRHLEWVNDAHFWWEEAGELVGNVVQEDTPKIDGGFRRMYVTDDPRSPYDKSSARDQVLAELKRLLNLYKDEEASITIIGHSLGAAIATINAVDIASNGYNKSSDIHGNNLLVTAFVFASPRVGDGLYKKSFDDTLNLKLLRIENLHDPVPKHPNIYTEVGEGFVIDTSKSTFIKNPINTAHNLECYLHGIAGDQGTNNFKLMVNRDVAFVNKDTDALEDEHLVPENWWIGQNNWMVLTSGGWKLIDYEDGNIDE